MQVHRIVQMHPFFRVTQVIALDVFWLKQVLFYAFSVQSFDLFLRDDALNVISVYDQPNLFFSAGKKNNRRTSGNWTHKSVNLFVFLPLTMFDS